MQIKLISKLDNQTYPKVDTTFLKKKVGRPSKKFELANEAQVQFKSEVVIYEEPEDLI